MSEGVASTHTCALPTWNAGASLHLHMAAFILILLLTYTRPSEFQALRKKDIVPPLVPLLPHWSVVIAASETGVSTADRCPRLVGPHGDQHFQWVNKLLTVYQTRHSGANIDLLQGFKTLQEMQRRAQWRAFIVVRHDEDSRLAVDYHSRSPAPRQV